MREQDLSCRSHLHLQRSFRNPAEAFCRNSHPPLCTSGKYLDDVPKVTIPWDHDILNSCTARLTIAKSSCLKIPVRVNSLTAMDYNQLDLTNIELLPDSQQQYKGEIADTRFWKIYSENLKVEQLETVRIIT